MTNEPAPSVDFVVELIDMGWALVNESALSYINDQLEMYGAAQRCTTWGEFRALVLDHDELRGLVSEKNGADGTPPEDADEFSLDLSDCEDLDRSEWLARATADALLELYEESGDALGDAFFDHFYDTGNGRAFLETKEQLDAAIVALEAHGYTVDRDGN